MQYSTGNKHYTSRESRAYEKISELSSIHQPPHKPSTLGNGPVRTTEPPKGINAPFKVKATAAADIDEDLIRKSLDHVNNFAKRHTEKLPQVRMYEINSSGESQYKIITLRALLHYVNDTIPDLKLFNGVTDCGQDEEPNLSFTTPEANMDGEHTVIGRILVLLYL